MAKNDKAHAQAKKGGKGIPRVTTAVLAMDEAGRKGWLETLTVDGNPVTDEVRAIVAANIVKALKKGSKVKGFNVESVIASLSKQDVSTLITIQKAIVPLIEAGKADAIQKLKDKMAADAAALAALGV